MKTKPAIDPAAAFPAAASAQPTEPELWTALGHAADPLRSVVTNLRAAQPAVTSAWQYSERSGWYQIHLLRKRRLLYLVPKHEDFRVSLILGRKAIEELKQGPFARQTAALLRTAKHYPEGTAFSFDRHSLAPDLLCALLDAKLAH